MLFCVCTRDETALMLKPDIRQLCIAIEVTSSPLIHLPSSFHAIFYHNVRTHGAFTSNLAVDTVCSEHSQRQNVHLSSS